MGNMMGRVSALTDSFFALSVVVDEPSSSSASASSTTSPSSLSSTAVASPTPAVLPLATVAAAAASASAAAVAGTECCSLAGLPLVYTCRCGQSFCSLLDITNHVYATKTCYPSLLPSAVSSPSSSSPTPAAKRVYIIRHGQSEFNMAVEFNGIHKDPMCFDARLTPLGEQQASLVATKLPDDVQLWVSSPLTRALHTCANALLQKQDSSATSKMATRPVVLVNDLCCEVLMDSCDMGRPVSVVAKEVADKFPMVDFDFENTPERFWYCSETPAEEDFGARCHQVFMEHPFLEPWEHAVERAVRFRQWIMDRPESCIAVFCHRDFMTLATGGGFYPKNCDVREYPL